MSINFPIFLHFIYLTSFDYVNESLKEYLLIGIYIFYAFNIYQNLINDQKKIKLIIIFLLPAIMILLSGIFSYISNQLNSVSNISLNLRDGIRLIGVFVCFSSIILSRNEISVKLIKFIIFTTLAIGLITSFLKENIIIAVVMIEI